MPGKLPRVHMPGRSHDCSSAWVGWGETDRTNAGVQLSDVATGRAKLFHGKLRFTGRVRGWNSALPVGRDMSRPIYRPIYRPVFV